MLRTARATPGTTLQDLNQSSCRPYTHPAIWLDAKTAALLGESDLVEPMNSKTLLPPGYGGRISDMFDNAFSVFLPIPSRS